MTVPDLSSPLHPDSRQGQPERDRWLRALAAGGVCLAILAGMIVGHAWPLWTGQDVILKATPVDPRDPFRGEFVRLQTPANVVFLSGLGSKAPPADAVVVRPMSDGWAAFDATAHRDGVAVGSLVYVQLERSASGEYHAATISRGPITDAVNLRGRVTFVNSDPRAIGLDFGLDAFYMEQGTPRAIEDALREGRNVQMVVAVAASGKSRIRALVVDGVRVGE